MTRRPGSRPVEYSSTSSFIPPSETAGAVSLVSPSTLPVPDLRPGRVRSPAAPSDVRQGQVRHRRTVAGVEPARSRCQDREPRGAGAEPARRLDGGEHGRMMSCPTMLSVTTAYLPCHVLRIGTDPRVNQAPRTRRRGSRRRRGELRARDRSTGQIGACKREHGQCWLMTPLGVMSQHTQCSTLGWRGLRPSTPNGMRCVAPVSDPPSMQPSPGGSLGRRMSAGRPRRPAAHGRPRPSTCSASSAGPPLRSGPFRVTAAPDRAGSLLRASRKADPPFSTGTSCAAPLSRRTGHRDRAVVVWQGRGLASSDSCPLRSARGAGVQAASPAQRGAER